MGLPCLIYDLCTAEEGMLQVGDVKYVQGPEAPVVSRWSARWRHRHATKQTRMLPLALPDTQEPQS